MKTYNVLEAKSNLSRLIAAVESGREREIIIARNGRPVARLAPLSPAGAGRRFGVAKGLFEVPDDIDTVNDAVARLRRPVSACWTSRLIMPRRWTACRPSTPTRLTAC